MDGLVSKSSELLKHIVSMRTGKRLEDVKPYSYQEESFKKIGELLDGSIDVLFIKAPCAAGKTEASILPFLAQYLEGKPRAPRIVYAAPIQTLLYNMQQRFTSYLEALRKLAGASIDVEKFQPVVEHGLEVDPQYLIPRFNLATYDVVAYAWVSRRTIPLRPFTTRGALHSSYIVFDEAHLLQDLTSYSQRVFPELIVSMASTGVPVVVMSATLPEQVVEHVREHVNVAEATFKNDTLSIGSIRVYSEKLDSDSIGLEDFLKLVNDKVLESVKESRDVLVIVNTVELAVKVLESIYNNLAKSLGYDRVAVAQNSSEAEKYAVEGRKAILVLLHGRLQVSVRREREDVFEKMKKLKKRQASKQWSIIVVATQVAETGVDYSFDTIVTELAPPSALIQRFMRAGRDPGQKSEVIVTPPVRRNVMPLSYWVYSRKLLDHGRKWLQENSQLSTSNLVDIEFLTRTASEEYNVIAGDVEESSMRVEKLVEEARKVLSLATHIPPLATRTQLKILERFRLRLGEYIALYIQPKLELGVDLEEFSKPSELASSLREALLKAYGGDESRAVGSVVNSSVRIPVQARREVLDSQKGVEKREGGRDSIVVRLIPRQAVWGNSKWSAVFYVTSLGELSLDYVQLHLRGEGGELYEARSLSSIYGRIVVGNPQTLTDFDPSKGLVEVEWVKVYE